jgi:hypothetical protein
VERRAASERRTEDEVPNDDARERGFGRLAERRSKRPSADDAERPDGDLDRSGSSARHAQLGDDVAPAEDEGGQWLPRFDDHRARRPAT